MNALHLRRGAAAAAVLATATLLFSGQAPARSATTAPTVADRVFTEPEDGINVKAGQLFLVALAANPSTGYRWKASSPSDAAIVAYKGSAYRAVRTGMMGAPGEEIFVYQARKPGSGVLLLEYLAPGTNAVGKTVRFHLTVAD